jgi:hypothetical protein
MIPSFVAEEINQTWNPSGMQQWIVTSAKKRGVGIRQKYLLLDDLAWEWRALTP